MTRSLGAMAAIVLAVAGCAGAWPAFASRKRKAPGPSTGPGAWSVPSLMPLALGTKRQGHAGKRSQQEQETGDFRSDAGFVHCLTLSETQEDTAVFRRPGGLGWRSLALRPRLATGLPWTVVRQQRPSLQEEATSASQATAMVR